MVDQGPQRRSTLRRMWEAVDTHPLPTLILLVGAISFFFWNTINSTTSMLGQTMAAQNTALGQSTTAFHSATTRIDGLMKDMGSATTKISQMEEQTRKIEEIRLAIGSIKDTVAATDAVLRSRKPYETRVIESFGINVDSDLIVDVVQGRVTAYPLTIAKANELEKAHFQRTTSSITRPVYAAGYAPPGPSAVVSGPNR